MSAPNTGAPTPTPAQTKAVARVTKRMGQDAAAGGVRPEQAYDALIQGKATGKPVILADVGGRNVGKLAGSVARAPGEASEFAEQSTKARLSGAGERLSGDVDKYIASGPTMRQSVQQLRADQRTAAAPLYAEALKPGSVAPLEKQFEEAFDEVSRAEKEANTALTQAQQQVTLAAAEKARVGDNVYAANRALRNERNAQTELEHATAETQEAAAAKQAVLTRLREAQTAAAAGERGGIWSPYIQRLLGNHNVQNGIKRGLEIQKNEADALNQPFNPNDYAVDAEDSVIRTPNMRLLDAAKKGLDAILEDYRDPTSGRLALDERGRFDRDAAQVAGRGTRSGERFVRCRPGRVGGAGGAVGRDKGRHQGYRLAPGGYPEILEQAVKLGKAVLQDGYRAGAEGRHRQEECDSA